MTHGPPDWGPLGVVGLGKLVAMSNLLGDLPAPCDSDFYVSSGLPSPLFSSIHSPHESNRLSYEMVTAFGGDV